MSRIVKSFNSLGKRMAHPMYPDSFAHVKMGT